MEAPPHVQVFASDLHEAPLKSAVPGTPARLRRLRPDARDRSQQRHARVVRRHRVQLRLDPLDLSLELTQLLDPQVPTEPILSRGQFQLLQQRQPLLRFFGVWDGVPTSIPRLPARRLAS